MKSREKTLKNVQEVVLEYTPCITMLRKMSRGWRFCFATLYWPNFWQLTVHVQQNVFDKTHIEICSPHLYASFGTFCFQIGQLFVAQWVFKHSEEFRNRRHFPSMMVICRFSYIIQRLTVPKRSVKMRTTNF